MISALLFGGIPGKLITLWKKAQITPVVSRDIIDEYIKVLAYPKFNLSGEEINYLLYQEIIPFFEVISVKQKPVIIKEDPSDDKFIRCAQSGMAEIIISGDHHLLSLDSLETKIHSPSQFLEEYNLE